MFSFRASDPEHMLTALWSTSPKIFSKTVATEIQVAHRHVFLPNPIGSIYIMRGIGVYIYIIYIYTHISYAVKIQHTKTIPLDPHPFEIFLAKLLWTPPEGHESCNLLGNLCVVCQSCRLYAWEGRGEVKRPWFLLEGWWGGGAKIFQLRNKGKTNRREDRFFLHIW